jgi:hypothetical protein
VGIMQARETSAQCISSPVAISDVAVGVNPKPLCHSPA